MTNETKFAYDSPGENWEVVGCARCGGDVDFEPCGSCGGDGCTEPGELYEEDPLWYDPEDVKTCGACGGHGGYHYCLNSPEWCKNHPMKGRENVERNLLEWRNKRPEKAKTL